MAAAIAPPRPARFTNSRLALLKAPRIPFLLPAAANRYSPDGRRATL